MDMGIRRIALALPALFLATSCGGEDPATATSTASDPSAPAATACADIEGDSTGVLDLTNVELDSSNDPVAVTFEWSGTVPQSGSVLWVVTVSAADGSTSRQLAYKVVDGEASAHFVFDFGTSTQDNIEGGMRLEAQRLVAEFPASAVDDLGEDWTWRAVLNVDGVDVDSCEPS